MKDSIGRENRRLEDKICPECGSIFRPLRATSKYCSRPCLWKNNGGRNKKQESWFLNSRGYIEGKVWIDDKTQIRVKQHRYIVEGIIGRPLRKDEDVHHIDGNKLNNNPENLEIINHNEHSRLTNSMREYKRGYKMNLSDEERSARSIKAIKMNLAEIGRNILKERATGLTIKEVLNES